MKIVISEHQFNLINESDVNRNITALEKHWRKKLNSGKQIRFDKDELEMWGITKRSDKIRTQILFQELVGNEDFAKKVINGLMNKKFSTKDFTDRIVGGVDFVIFVVDIHVVVEASTSTNS